MTSIQKCSVCHGDFDDNMRVIFSSRETFVFKPAHVPDPEILEMRNGVQVKINVAATQSPEYMRELRKEYLRTAVVNTFVDWGKAVIPEGAFHFRHQWCEPQKTASGIGPRSNRHAIRFSRKSAGVLHG